MNIENIKVKTVGTEKLIDFLNIQLNENQKLEINKFAIFKDKFNIDTDCCFSELEDFHFDNKIAKAIEIECRIKTYVSDSSYTIRMDKPDFRKVMDLEKYLELATEVKLVDFIRYNYNPRIMSNQKLLMKYIRESYK